MCRSQANMTYACADEYNYAIVKGSNFGIMIFMPWQDNDVCCISAMCLMQGKCKRKTKFETIAKDVSLTTA